MQSKIIYLAVLLFLYSFGLFSQTKQKNHPDIPEGYNRKYKVNTEKRWNNRRVDAIVVDTSGNIFKGQVLSIESEKLTFYVSDTPFYKFPNLDLIYSFNSEEISRVMLERHSKAKQGAIIGAVTALATPIYVSIEFARYGEAGWLIILVPVVYFSTAVITGPIGLTIGYLHGISLDYKTGGDTASFKILAEEFKKYAVFPDELPGDYLKDISNEKIAQPEISVPEYRSKKRDPLGFNKFDIGLSAGPVFTNASDNINKGIRNSLPAGYKKNYQTQYPNFDFDFGYRFKPNLRLGLGVSGWAYQADFDNFVPEQSNTTFSFNYSTLSFSLNGDYIFNPVRRLMSRRGEFSIGLGISASNLSGYVFEDDFIKNGDYFESSEIDIEPVFVTHADVSIAYDLYLFQFVSIRASINGQQALSKIKTKEFIVTDFSEAQYKIPPFEVNISSLSAELGLRFHF